jgi:hypothetical protein
LAATDPCRYYARSKKCAHWHTHALNTLQRTRVWGVLSENVKLTIVNSYPRQSQTTIISRRRQQFQKQIEHRGKVSWNIHQTSVQICRKVMYCAQRRLRCLNFHQKCQVIALQNSYPTAHKLWVIFFSWHSLLCDQRRRLINHLRFMQWDVLTHT